MGLQDATSGYWLAQNLTITSIISIISFCCVGTYYYLRNVYSFWERQGVRGPRPWPFVGTFPRVLLVDRMKLEVQWVKEYGKVYATYLGLLPRLVIADPEVVMQISVKDFDKFRNHRGFSELSNEYQRNFLINLKDDHWKKVRSLMSPTFTSGKIKRMFKLLDKCANDLVDCFGEQLPQSGPNKTAVVNLKETYNLFTMDAITTCCYGLKLERAGSTNLKTAATRDDFVKNAMKFFDFSVSRIAISTILPTKLLQLLGFQTSPKKNLEPMAERVRKLISARRKSTKKFDDYLQLLIDAKIDAEMELGELDLQENHHAGLTHESLKQDQEKMVDQLKLGGTSNFTLDDLEVLSNAVFLMVVGLETTGTLLTNVSYALAYHPEIQQRLYKELRSIAKRDGDEGRFSFDYESLTSCKYLDAVISETLRMLAPVLQIDRVANSDYRIEKYNIDLKAGQVVNFGFYAIMNDPDYWESPEKFNPERFMPENKEKIVPGSYCPFGLGPRHCIGMRFSLTEAKLALAKTMMQYRFYPAPGTVFPPEAKRSLALNNINVPCARLAPREEGLKQQ